MSMIDIYKQAYFNRQFEIRVAEAHQKGLIKAPIYLSVGTEHIPAAIADISKEWLIFPQHRCHSWLLSFGADASLVAKEILGYSDGLNQGYGGSASLGCPELNIYPHDGHLGSNLPIGVGACMATGKPTLIHLGDAAIEENLDVFGFIATQKLPVFIVVEDNDLSILTETKVRRSWNIAKVAESLGMVTDDIKDYPGGIRDRARVFLEKHKKGETNPTLINVRCNRFCWHCGTNIQIDKFKDILVWLKGQLVSDWDNWQKEEAMIERLEQQIKRDLDAIWNPLIGESNAV